MRKWIPWAVAGAGLLLSGCSELPYYRQAVAGHLELIAEREPIDALLQDAKTDPELARQLETIRELLNFAQDRLALTSGGSYSHYVDLGRPYVTWNVFAAPELSVTPLQWCFPFSGCVSYRGYFDRDEAQGYASGLSDKGYEVSIQGAIAYSTLGWLDDPVLSSMLGHGEAFLAETLFHELAHRRLYVKDDTPFNEGFAVSVQEEGVRRWFRATDRPERLAAYERALHRREAVLRLVDRARERLTDIYALNTTSARKRTLKEQTLNTLRSEYRLLRDTWGGVGGYDRWFDAGLNNARLASLATYREWVPQFRSLYQSCDRSLPRFYAAVEGLGSLDPATRHQRLKANHPCPAAQRGRGDRMAKAGEVPYWKSY